MTSGAGRTIAWNTANLPTSITQGTSSGLVIERFSYDPHGKRRNVNWTPTANTLTGTHTGRGFTGHQHPDEVGLIHMTKSPGAILSSRRLAPQGRGQG